MAKRMVSKFLSDTKRKEEELDPVVAMYLQGVRGRKEVRSLESKYSCQITVSSLWQREVWKGRTPRGHEVLVCEGILAAADCQVIVLPLSDGQSEWPPLQKHVLDRSFLNPNLNVYASEVGHSPQPRTMTLVGNTGSGKQGDHVTAPQSVIIMSVPQASDKQFNKRVDEACEEAFRKLKAGGATSIAFPVQLSAGATKRKCLDALLPAIVKNLEQREDACTVMLCLEPLTSAERGELVKALRESRLETEASAEGAVEVWGLKPPLLTTRKPSILLRGHGKDVTTSFKQIRQVRVPEAFRRHAIRLMKFLEDQSVEGGDTTCQTNFRGDQPLPQDCQEGGVGQGTSLVTEGSQISLTELAPNSSTANSSGTTSTASDPGLMMVTPPAKTEGNGDVKLSLGDQMSQQPGPSGGSGGVVPFVTKSGIKVHVYKADLTTLMVDAIVNTANEQLSHGGGVAYAIARAAGYSLKMEGDDYIRRHGPLKVTEVVVTTGGSLPCKKVLHAVGPRWSDYTDKAECRQRLVDTIYKCLLKADSLGFTSVALPSMSSGIFGVPQPICAESYLSAVQKFGDQRGNCTSLTHIHFVDDNDDMVTTIQQTFTAEWNTVTDQQIAATSDEPELSGASRFVTKSGIKVDVYKTDITKLPVDAIVNAANEKRCHAGGVAAIIARAVSFSPEDEGNDYVRRHGPLKVTEVAVTTGGSLPCKKVLHAVGPHWFDYMDKKECRQRLVDTVYNCLLKADSLGFTSVALPSLSSGIFGVPQLICAESYLSAVQKFGDQRENSTSLTHIHFVDVNDDMVTTIQQTFTAKWNTVTGQQTAATPNKPGLRRASRFVTKSGIKVKVYKIDITQLPVDAMINAANEQLSHGDGVAYAIARTAGFELENECQDYIRRHGPLKVTEVAVTTGGSLPCKKVLHAVGPRWSDYTDKAECRQHLVDTVYECLLKADGLGFASVALPSISSGIFGVPQQICAESYLLAVQKFDDERGKSTSLTLIHFVDVNGDMVTTIQQTFTAKWNTATGQQTAATPNEPEPSGAKTFVSKSGIQMDVYKADLTKLTVDAIVHAANAQLSHREGVAYAIAKAAGYALKDECQDYIRRHGPLKVTEVAVTTGGSLPCKKVLHAVGPRWSDYTDKAECRQHLVQTVYECLLKADNLGFTSVALPSISSAIFGVPRQICAESYLLAVQKFDDQHGVSSSLKHIHFADASEDMVTIIQKTFDRVTERIDTGVIYSKQDADSLPACNICSDTVTQPKTLDQCGHTFCSACLDRCFATNPVCPDCQTVYGIITGDQPRDGKMRMYKEPNSLPGFLGDTDTFVIEYTFPPGRQSVEHPNPGRPYTGTERKAYLPNTAEGRKVLMLLKIAFDRRLVFTVGRSETTGQEGIVWNGIHHKTDKFEGSSHGYPDDLYLSRVQQELAAKGVTDKDLTDTQREFIHRPGPLLPYTEFSSFFN